LALSLAAVAPLSYSDVTDEVWLGGYYDGSQEGHMLAGLQIHQSAIEVLAIQTAPCGLADPDPAPAVPPDSPPPAPPPTPAPSGRSPHARLGPLPPPRPPLPRVGASVARPAPLEAPSVVAPGISRPRRRRSARRLVDSRA